jgi:acetate kinase
MAKKKQNALIRSKSILTLNAGSSSLKFAIYENIGKTLKHRYSGLIDYAESLLKLHLKKADGETAYKTNLEKNKSIAEQIIDCIEMFLPNINLEVISHRLVHGGKKFTDATLIDANNLDQLNELRPLAPIHLPAEIDVIESILKRLPNTKQVACFDTAFHHKVSDLAKMLPLPRPLFDEGIIRYGFHDLSYEYITSQLDADHGKTIVVHLGSGASVCAIKNRQSVDHSMGFSTNERLMMSTRSGSIDIGVILYLLEHKKYTIEDVHSLLYERSGLLGVSGISGDIRQLVKDNSVEAQFAIDFFCYRAAAEIGKLLPALGGIDSLIFTAGIGENSPIVREKICNYLQWLGLIIDATANKQNELIISHKESRITVQVIPTDEEFVLASKALTFIS